MVAPPVPAKRAGVLKPNLAVVAAFFVFALLLTWRLGEREMWLDETITVGHTNTPESVYDAFHPMGYYWLLYRWRQVFGGSDLALRAFSVPWALASLLLVWLLGRALLPPPQAALAAWLYALSPFVLLYARAARYFALTGAVALAVAYFALLAWREGKWWQYLGLGLASAMLLWTNYVPSLFLPLVYGWLLVVAWRRRQRAGWLLAAAFPLALAVRKAEWMLFSAREVAGISAPPLHTSAQIVLLKLLLPFYAALVGETTDFWRFQVVIPVALAGLVLWGAGVVAVWRHRQSSRWLLLLPWPATVLAVAFVLTALAPAEPWPRASSLSLFALPFFLLTLAAGAGALPRPAAVLLVAIFLLGQGYGVCNYLTRQQFLNPGYNVPWRQVNEFIQSRGKPGDIAVAWWDAPAGRYFTGPVRFVDLVDETLTWQPLPPEVANFPRSGASVWVIARERGSHLARSRTQRLLAELGAKAGSREVYRFLPLSPQEQYWRSRLGGQPVGDAHLRVYCFSP